MKHVGGDDNSNWRQDERFPRLFEDDDDEGDGDNNIYKVEGYSKGREIGTH